MNYNFRLLIYSLSFISAVSMVLVNDAIPFFFILCFCFLLSLFYKSEARNIYLLSLSANVIFGCILVFVFQSQNQSFFDTGGDDSKFFGYFLDAASGDSIYFEIRYGNYIWLGATFVKILKYIGIDEITPILIYPLNWLYGANVCALTYIFGLQIGVSKRAALISSSLLAVYPYFLLVETKMLRDILGTLAMIAFFVTYYSKVNKFIKASIILLICLFLLKLRAEYVLYFMGFAFINIAFYLYEKRRTLLLASLIVVCLVALFVGYNYLLQITGRNAEDLVAYTEVYGEIRENNENSIGSKLKNAGGVFNVITWFYLWISPFPPPALQVFNLTYLIVSIGALFWYRAYIKFPFLISKYFKSNGASALSSTIKRLACFVIGCSVIVTLVSADSRHLTAFYPFVFLIYGVISENYPDRNKKVLNALSSFGAIGLFFLYLVIKLV